MRKSLSLLFIVVIIFTSCQKDDAPGLPFAEQLKKDVALVDAYLVSNAINAIKDSSGVRYLVNTIGVGEKPSAGSDVYVSFKGKLLPGGQVFSDSNDTYAQVTLGNPYLLACWQLVIPKMNKGGTFTIYSPSGLAYGASSSPDGKLPSNANVIFDIKLFDEVAQYKLDTTAIESYLTANNIIATTDATGLRYVITLTGTGAKPTPTNSVTFNYNGKLLSTGVSFEKSTAPITTPLSNIIKGLQVGFQLLPVGSKATFYIPSSQAYGPSGSQGVIPGNANLIFEIELVSIN